MWDFKWTQATQQLSQNMQGKQYLQHFIDKILAVHMFFFSFFRLNNLAHSSRPREARKSCDTEPSCQAADVLSQMLSRCWFSHTAICSKALLSPNDTAHPKKTSCSHRECCPGSRQDMIQDVVQRCCQRISNCWHVCERVIPLIGRLRVLFLPSF